MKKKKVIVVGGGPAGMMAAGQAALHGADVILFERMHTCGSKLLLTGNGRCNYSNSMSLDKFIREYTAYHNFLKIIFKQFFSEHLCRFFDDLGISSQIESDGRIFPSQDNAHTVKEKMVTWLQTCNVSVCCSTEVVSLNCENNHIKGVTYIHPLSSEKTTASMVCDAVIVASGGKSYPSTGSNGNSYDFIQQCGHTITALYPGCTGLKTDEKITSSLAGLTLKNVKITVMSLNAKFFEATGDLLFTHNGLSGPVVLTASNYGVPLLSNGEAAAFLIDFIPAYSEQFFEHCIIQHCTLYGKQTILSLLRSYIPCRLIEYLCKILTIDTTLLCCNLSKDLRKKIIKMCKNFLVPLEGFNGFDHAFITIGGVVCDEVYPRTMESKIVGNLYFCGEILDINGNSGGYNLQAAFSTGYSAGIHAANKLSIQEKE